MVERDERGMVAKACSASFKLQPTTGVVASSASMLLCKGILQ